MGFSCIAHKCMCFKKAKYEIEVIAPLEENESSLDVENRAVDRIGGVVGIRFMLIGSSSTGNIRVLTYLCENCYDNVKLKLEKFEIPKSWTMKIQKGPFYHT